MRLRSFLTAAFAFTLLAGCGAPEEPIGVAEQAIKVCPGPTVLEGVDISHWNGTINWGQVKGSGRAFSIVKATEGTGYVDPTFDTNWAGMKAKGVVRGSYHFFHADVDPIAQADHYLNVAGALEPGDLPPTLDLETLNGQSGTTITKNAIAWLDHVAAATGMTPLLYTSPGFVGGLGTAPVTMELDKHAVLWVAHWGTTCPTVPPPFTTWAFWQYDAMGTVPGTSGDVDLDQFNGSMADLMAITVPASSSSSSSSSSSTAASSSSSTSASSSSGAGGAGGAGGGVAIGGMGGAGTTTTPPANGGEGGAAEGPLTPASGGCGCTTAGETGGEAPILAALAALAIALRRRPRRR